MEELTMKYRLLLPLLFVGIAMIIPACGGQSGKTDSSAPVKETQVKQPESSAQPAGDNEGTAVAKEILATFDKAVAEVAELVKNKPEAAELKPKLEALYRSYEEKMKALNTNYLALKDKDISLFGAANGYLGENRGKHVFNKDNVLGEYISYYNFQKGEKEIVDMLSSGIVKMLDVAVQR
jgi:DNA repair exonuclease SbcCD ATPase subunit